jgi:hypothetical protein
MKHLHFRIGCSLALLALFMPSVSGSERLGVFKVSSPSGNRVGTTWLVDAEHGLLLTAAHVAWDAGASQVGDSIQVVAEYLSDALRLDRPLRCEFEATLVCWGLPASDSTLPPDPGAEDERVRSWIKKIKEQPSPQDWALLQVIPPDKGIARAILQFYSALPVHAFGTSQSLTNARGDFVVHGYPSGTSGLQRTSGPLARDHQHRSLYTIAARVAPGNSGGPVVGHLPGAPEGQETAVGIVLHFAENPDYSLLVGLHSIRAQIAASAGSSERVKRITGRFFTDGLPVEDADWLDVLAALQTLNFFEHLQLVTFICSDSSSGQSICDFLRAYYEDYRAADLVGTLLDCRSELAQALGKEASRLAGRWLEGEHPDEIEVTLLREAADHLVAMSSVPGWTPPFESSSDLAAMLRDTARVLHFTDGREKSSLELQRRAVLVADAVDREGATSDDQLLALALVVDPDISLFGEEAVTRLKLLTSVVGDYEIDTGFAGSEGGIRVITTGHNAHLVKYLFPEEASERSTTTCQLNLPSSVDPERLRAELATPIDREKLRAALAQEVRRSLGGRR